ncbi:IS3 family transposase [Deinococcus sp. NW-56]|uniref:DDE-type integrase/transposase/recombinase n=1 Tax=Deinococcus sp. NW-56 TaxID=2080419 RepID=UPI000CF3E02D
MLGFSRTTQRRNSPKREKDQRLVERLRTLARERPRFGYRRIHLMLGREGETVNHKRVYRIYRAEGLAVRKKERRKLSVGERQQKPQVSAPNQRWSLDFMSDQLASGQRFRVLNVVDDFTRECLVMHVGTSITGHDVVRALEAVVRFRGHRSRSPPTMAQSSRARAWISGPMGVASRTPSSGRGSPSRTLTSRVSTAVSGTSV